jgi:hypothetical protein
MKLAIAFLISLAAFAHQGEKHGIPAANLDPSTLKQVSDAYSSRIRPIFEKKCFDCHSSQVRYPWYYKLPLIKQLIDHDIAEGREHLDMTEGFPFKSHETPEADLREIAETTRDQSMPPFLYLLMHTDSHLSAEEQRVILEWVETSLSQLI